MSERFERTILLTGEAGPGRENTALMQLCVGTAVCRGFRSCYIPLNL